MVCRPLDTGHSTKNSCVKVTIFGSRFIFDIEEVGEEELSGLISDAILGDLKTQFLFQRLRNFENISGRGTLNPCSALLESEFENSRLAKVRIGFNMLGGFGSKRILPDAYGGGGLESGVNRKFTVFYTLVKFCSSGELQFHRSETDLEPEIILC